MMDVSQTTCTFSSLAFFQKLDENAQELDFQILDDALFRSLGECSVLWVQSFQQTFTIIS